jgi:hypothetical protein
MDRSVIILAALILAPAAIVLTVALLRGYDVTVIFHRGDRRRGDQ